LSTSRKFLSPRLVGERFDGHAIPLEVLKDLAVLEEMVVEVAKWCYLQDHQERQRVPRGFTDGISLKLTAVDEGSAVPVLEAFPARPELLPTGAEAYFDRARDAIIMAIDAAEHDQPITEHLPDSLLGYFDRLGRSLRDDELIEFAPERTDRPARLNRNTRRKLLLTSSQVRELTEEVQLRGAIPEADQAKMSFDLQIIGGPRVSAPIAAHHLSPVLEAFNGYAQGIRVIVQGIGRFNRHNRIQSIESIEHISVLDANDVGARLDELRTLKHGWLDGKGQAPSQEGLDWLARHFAEQYPDDLPVPYLYPTAEGGVQVEWSLEGRELSLEIDLTNKHGEWHLLDLATEEEQYQVLNLTDDRGWWTLAEWIRSLVNGEA